MKALFGGILFLLNPVTEFGRSFKRLIKGFNRICEKRKDNSVNLHSVDYSNSRKHCYICRTWMVVQQLFGRDQFLSLVIHLDQNVAPEKGLEIW